MTIAIATGLAEIGVRSLLFGLALAWTSVGAQAAERPDWDPFTRQPNAPDLVFPKDAEPFTRSTMPSILPTAI